MELRLDLPFRLKIDDMLQFLDQEERDTLNRHILEEWTAVPVQDRNDARMALVVSETRQAYFADPVCAPAGMPSRVVGALLAMAMKAKYPEKMPRTEGPKLTPGKTWGHMQDELDARPDVLHVAINQAPWLVAVWFDEKVQNGLPPEVQRWANVLEDEITRFKQLIEDPKAQVTIPKELPDAAD